MSSNGSAFIINHIVGNKMSRRNTEHTHDAFGAGGAENCAQVPEDLSASLLCRSSCVHEVLLLFINSSVPPLRFKNQRFARRPVLCDKKDLKAFPEVHDIDLQELPDTSVHQHLQRVIDDVDTERRPPGVWEWRNLSDCWEDGQGGFPSWVSWKGCDLFQRSWPLFFCHVPLGQGAPYVFFFGKGRVFYKLYMASQHIPATTTVWAVKSANGRDFQFKVFQRFKIDGSAISVRSIKSSWVLSATPSCKIWPRFFLKQSYYKNILYRTHYLFCGRPFWLYKTIWRTRFQVKRFLNMTRSALKGPLSWILQYRDWAERTFGLALIGSLVLPSCRQKSSRIRITFEVPNVVASKTSGLFEFCSCWTWTVLKGVRERSSIPWVVQANRKEV